ncbi:phage antirepressor N-terminal domain-containing protein [Micromonospora chersina]|uniref:phage antirepressor N-terminal domain-containing protein n=1 Tax=Micromonospora chersina TaxID=47854 RepID=UPI0037A91CA1
MSDIVKVPFMGGHIESVLVDGEPHVVLRPALEAVGLNYGAQLEKLKTRSWAVVRQTETTGADGKTYLMATVNLDTWAMLLANIHENRVAEAVRPVVVEYQKGSARALREYWTQGGAINPHATEDQLASLIGHAEGQMRVLRLADGLVDRAWLEPKARHVTARALGEEPEVNPADRPLSTGEFLQEKGITGPALRSISGTFGKKVKPLYVARYGHEPAKVERFVDGALRQVNGYTERDRDLMEQAWAQLLGVRAAS